MNLQDAKLLRVKDKKFDWGKLKKVRILTFLTAYIIEF